MPHIPGVGDVGNRAKRAAFATPLFPAPCSLFFSRTIHPALGNCNSIRGTKVKPAMLGKQISETKGKRIVRRVLSTDPPTVEVTFEDSGPCTAFPPPAWEPTPQSSLPISRSQARARESSPPRTARASAGQARGSANSVRPEPSAIAACSSSKTTSQKAGPPQQRQRSLRVRSRPLRRHRLQSLGMEIASPSPARSVLHPPPPVRSQAPVNVRGGPA